MRPLLAALVLVVGLTACSNREAVRRAPETWTEPWTGMDFVRLDAGTFDMGSPPGETGRQEDERLHRAGIGRPFYFGRHEVTQAQWHLVMGSNPSHFQSPVFASCDGCPVEQVNFWQVQDFLDRLSARTGHRFRLPTETEWEVACRAGTDTAFAFGDELILDRANFDADGHPPEERDRTAPVGSYPANPWGLFDLHGNVWEWTSDPLCPYPEDGATRHHPSPGCESPWKVIRGGSFHFGADSARCALRYTHRPRDLGPSLGFRAVREISLHPPS